MKLLAIFAVGALAQFVNTPPYHSIAISQEAGNADAVLNTLIHAEAKRDAAHAIQLEERRSRVEAQLNELAAGQRLRRVGGAFLQNTAAGGPGLDDVAQAMSDLEQIADIVSKDTGKNKIAELSAAIDEENARLLGGAGTGEVGTAPAGARPFAAGQPGEEGAVSLLQDPNILSGFYRKTRPNTGVAPGTGSDPVGLYERKTQSPYVWIDLNKAPKAFVQVAAKHLLDEKPADFNLNLQPPQESAAAALASVRAIAAREEAVAAQADGAFAADLAQVYRRKLASLRGGR